MLRRRIQLLALRRVSPRIRRTASSHVAQFGTRPLAPAKVQKEKKAKRTTAAKFMRVFYHILLPAFLEMQLE
jgi:hypothetical protein